MEPDANGTGDVTISPGPAGAQATALEPNVDEEAPQFILYMHQGRPVIYQRFDEEG